MYFSVFRSPVRGPVIRAVFLEWLLYLPLSFQNSLPLRYNGYWVKWDVKNLTPFFLPKGKITRCLQDHLHNVIIFIKYPIHVSFSQIIWKWDHEILRKLSPRVPSNPLMLPQLSFDNFKRYEQNLNPLTNPCFLFLCGIKNCLSGNLMSPGLSLFQ